MSNPSAGTSSKPKVGSSQPSEASFKRKRGVFQKDLQHMLYGFGDDANLNGSLKLGLRCLDSGCEFRIWSKPFPETVTLVEDIVVEYVTDLTHKAQDIGSKRGKLSVEDFLYLIRKDTPKLNRCTELLSMQEELKQARKAFEVDEEKLATLE
ncbi:transcription initiation factor TFIID subunit 13-like [Hibiscus syriacus]|uniref:transcription initiation factor TFIID subunit 13-like n=1 Tax=Hibiscus syriacus TaxID=106335 RepID=UPI001921E8B2|nr:transcription initiation factor TFIID subunit 13-like [Hibiscus syriacus]